MTIEELQTYRYAAAEVEALQLQIQQLYNPVRSPNLFSIGARGNSVSDPTHSSVMKADELQRQLEEKQEALRAKAIAIEEWLSTVGDNKIRTAIRWHFLLGATWRETARKVDGTMSADAFRMAFFRWFDENEKEKVENQEMEVFSD